MSTSAGPSEFWQDLEDHLVERVVQRVLDGLRDISPGTLVNTLEASKTLGISERTLARWADAGCPCVRLAGGRRRWDLSQVKEWLESRGGGR